jgi:hypothetical protein
VTRNSVFPLAAAALAILAGTASAQDEGLYPQATAPDASFLRVHVAGDEAVAVDDQTLLPGESGLTPYIEVAPGPVAVSIDGEVTTVEAAPNTHYSFVQGTDGGELLTDGVTGSPAQADLVFLNLSDIAAVDAFVPSANAVALEDVAPGASAAVALRAPLTIDLELRDGDETVAQVAGVELVRSGGTTVVLTGEAGTYEAAAAPNTYAD